MNFHQNRCFYGIIREKQEKCVMFNLTNRLQKWIFIGAALLMCSFSISKDSKKKAKEVHRSPTSGIHSTDSKGLVDESHPLFSESGLPPFENLEVKRSYEERGAVTKGIMLEFQRWPNPQEANMIFKVTNKLGLTRTAVFQKDPFKTWDFDWPYITFRRKAVEACESFPKEIHQILEFCSSSSLSYPD